MFVHRNRSGMVEAMSEDLKRFNMTRKGLDIDGVYLLSVRASIPRDSFSADGERHIISRGSPGCRDDWVTAGVEHGCILGVRYRSHTPLHCLAVETIKRMRTLYSYYLIVYNHVGFADSTSWYFYFPLGNIAKFAKKRIVRSW